METKRQKLTVLALSLIFLVSFAFSVKIVDVVITSYARALNDELKIMESRSSAIEREVEKKDRELEQKTVTQNRTAAR